MEFPVLLELPLPATCRKLVTQFLRPGELHPTARLINLLTFRRDEAGYDSEDEDQCFPACLGVTGPGIRILDLSLWHPFGAVQPQCLVRRPQYVVRVELHPSVTTACVGLDTGWASTMMRSQENTFQNEMKATTKAMRTRVAAMVVEVSEANSSIRTAS